MNNLKIEIPSNLKIFFKKKKTRSVGVDVGSDSIKIVELAREKKSLVLKNYALVKTNRDLIKEGSGGIINDDAGKAIKNIFKEIEIKEKNINVAVPSFTSLVTTMELEFPANASEGEIEQIIQVEAPKFIPVPLGESIYGWQIIEKDDKIEKDSLSEDETGKNKNRKKENVKNHVVLVAIMKEISEKYEKVFSNNDFKVDVIEVDVFSLMRALTRGDRNNYLLLDMGGKICNIAIIYKGGLVLNRSIDVSGSKMTESIAKIMNISQKRAEQFKIEKGLEGKHNDIREQVLLPLINNICDESKKALDIFNEEYSTEKIENVILTGGGSQLKGLKKYLEENLKLKVLTGNPWSGITHSKQLEKNLLELSPIFGVAVGLAILGLDE